MVAESQPPFPWKETSLGPRERGGSSQGCEPARPRGRRHSHGAGVCTTCLWRPFLLPSHLSGQWEPLLNWSAGSARVLAEFLDCSLEGAKKVQADSEARCLVGYGWYKVPQERGAAAHRTARQMRSVGRARSRAAPGF